MSDGLDVIESGLSRTVDFLGEKIEIRPLTIGQLPAFVRYAKPVLAGVFKDGPVEVSSDEMFELIEDHGEALCQAIAVAIGKSPGQVGQTDPAEFVALAAAVVAVNLDFFVHRLAPETAKALTALTGAGRILSSRLSAPATP